ncbi:acyltransferase [Frondihabitans sp. VKM Ac-2883]|uniref:acyltransferase n=1 Tax=Frondihabitans sp. VKM Ac-2883 TaxID=2783823 RepID=UPI00351C25A9
MIIRELKAFEDDRGNRIEYTGEHAREVKITIRGENNRIAIDSTARLGRFVVDMDCDNGSLTIGAGQGAPPLNATIRIGQDSTVTIGDNVSSTNTCVISATEGTSVSIGNDVMLASQTQIRADDGHAIFDVETGDRVNVSRSISIGNHVWLGMGAAVLGGASIGDGTVIGYGSLVTRALPNNCVAVGTPAKVVRRNVAWERAHLSLSKPFYKPDASTVEKSSYWHMTEDPEDDSSEQD